MAVPHKTDVTLNDCCWMENDGDVVVLHMINEWFKFGINVEV